MDTEIGPAELFVLKRDALLRQRRILLRALRRGNIPHIRIRLRRGSGHRRAARHYRCAHYGVRLDELVQAIARFVPLSDPDQPRPPKYDDAADTVTFFFDSWPLAARRRGCLRSGWQLAAMLTPAIAGLAIVGYYLPAAGVLVVLASGEALLWRRLDAVLRQLRLGRRGNGRLRLTSEHLVWTGTDVPIPWGHVRDAMVVQAGRPYLTGVIRCPGPEDGDPGPEDRCPRPEGRCPGPEDPCPGPEGRCRFHGRRIGFKVSAFMYAATIEQVRAAFARHITVADES